MVKVTIKVIKVYHKTLPAAPTWAPFSSKCRATEGLPLTFEVFKLSTTKD